MKGLNKTKLSKKLGVSRPTLYKMIKEKTVPEYEMTIPMQSLVLKASSLCNKTSPSEIDSFLEFLGDNRMLNEDGKHFASVYWEIFIKQ
jgi:DNA-binding XRE family transcriptional regulator